MAVVFQQKRKIQQYLILIFIGVLLISIVVFWYGFGRREEAFPTDQETGFGMQKEVRLNLDVLKNPVLETLEPFVKIKSFEGQAGRENPFVPY